MTTPSEVPLHFSRERSATVIRPLVVLLSLAGVAIWVAVDRPVAAIAEAPGGAPADSKSTAKPVDAPATKAREEEAEPEKAIVSGKVMLLSAAFKELGIKHYDEETKGQVVLLTREKELIPIVPDWRGRAFFQDERLRDRPVDLLVHRRKGIPWVQVMSIYTFDEKGVRNATDYWCDVCAIPMYEIKECECCQGPIRLRFRPQELPGTSK